MSNDQFPIYVALGLFAGIALVEFMWLLYMGTHL